LHPTVIEKAAALAFSLIMNHAFVDGNKRVGFWAMDTFLRLNGCCVEGSAEEGEAMCLALASGGMTREHLTGWLTAHCHPLPPMSETPTGGS
jgi:death on curing protein